MKQILTLFFVAYALCLYSCSSGSSPQTGTASAPEQLFRDTALHGLAGVIETNPPVENGDYVAKYPNGIVKMRGFYIKGKRNGQWVCFFENGQPQSEGFYKDGLRDGKAVVYYPTGEVYYTGYYKDGKEAGKWVFFDTSGKKIQEKDFGNPSSSQVKANS